MKKALLSIACFLACSLYPQSQTLYGLTRFGGSNNDGAIIKFIPGSNNLTVARSFEDNNRYPGYSNFIQASDGKLYYTATDGTNSDYGAIFSFNPSNATYTKLKALDKINGANPGGLVQASNGKLYGMTLYGGSYGYSYGGFGFGVIFSFDPSSSTYTKLMDFDGTNGSNPTGSLVQASDGKLYGMAGGGSNSYGVIFSFDLSSSTYTKLMDFDGSVSGANPSGSLMQASNGKLYGMTNSGGNSQAGVIFSFDPSTSTFAKLKDFDYDNGAHPNGSLVQASNGKLYGVAMEGGGNQHGVIFSLDPSTTTYTKLKDFYGPVSGAYPAGDLVKASDGKLYGMTVWGWSTYPYPGYGFLFSFDPLSNTYTKLKDFNNPDDSPNPYKNLVQATDGKLYGISNFGVIFSYTPSSSAFTKLVDLNVNDGRYPYGSLVQASNGKLYGITNDGGSGRYPDGGGVIFSYDPLTSSYTKLADFTGYTNGSKPLGSLVQANNGKLYGMTWGGSNDDADGVIYSFDPSTSAFTRLMSFEEGFAWGSLIQASDGKLYGMTSGGATASYASGIIFSYDLLTSVYTKLVDFDGTNGSYPTGDLVQASNGKLYGMTTEGGRNGYGVIFSFDPATSNYRKLEDFDGSNGAYPFGSSLVQASNGKLYGMTNGGGSSDRGVIFSFELQNSKLTRLKDFDSTNGAYPAGRLMQASDGKLYGMTTSGGSSNLGVAFSFDPSSSTFTKLKDFDSTNGAHPYLGAAFIELKGNGVLPVTALSFAGKNNGSINQLSWKIEQEQDLVYYELQRSVDGQIFKEISQAKATGSKSYSYDDQLTAPVALSYYYRLKIVEKDGGYSYSGIVKLNVIRAYQLSIAPNPISTSTTISFTLPQSQKVSICIYDITGKLIKTLADMQMQGGIHQLTWDATNDHGVRVSAGNYFLKMLAGNYSETKKLAAVK